jgi:hypothetical protein
LTTKLPFDDDEFDHVHIQSIAKGVPENKVDSILDCPTLLTLSATVGGLVRSELSCLSFLRDTILTFSVGSQQSFTTWRFY